MNTFYRYVVLFAWIGLLTGLYIVFLLSPEANPWWWEGVARPVAQPVVVEVEENYAQEDELILEEISAMIDDIIVQEPVETLLTIEDFPDDYATIDIVEIPQQIIATVINEGALWQRNDDAFDYLAGFIFGDNSEADKIAMTSPVVREQLNDSSYETAFIMPDGWTMKTLPDPNNDRVEIKEIPWSLQAVWRFSWYTTETAVDSQWELFQQDLEKEWITWYGLPTLAQYDWPWVWANRRRNELRVSLNP